MREQGLACLDDGPVLLQGAKEAFQIIALAA